MIKVIIVDGFSSGKFVAKRLHTEGCTLLHIASSKNIDDYYYADFDYSIYQTTTTHDDLTSTLLLIEDFNPDYIIAGAESGVLLADVLNSEAGLLYCNEFDTSNARRNKHQMIANITSAGLPAAQQVRVNHWGAAEAWIKGHGKFPVVLKPLESAGADGAYVCSNLQECRAAFFKIFEHTNKLNIRNSEVLIQEYLAGTEYVVNRVSLNGESLVTEVVKYTKKLLDTGNIIYDIDELIDSTSAHYHTLVDYSQKVASCLGIKNGPSHAEIMMTSEGPKLVEIAARTDGILRDSVCLQTTQFGQIAATALSITHPEKFARLIESAQPYTLIQNTYNVCLINHSEGIFDKEKFVQQLMTLDSFFEAVFYVKDGSHVRVTRDVFSQPGTVYLVHPELSVIKSDYRKIRAMEAMGMYLKASSLPDDE